ncbi:hypothetical protein [Leptospira stimsonii]|uniref:hypothetical protein n=1 Tax=Leptospira stimsonii TaxID=2202203 RepID=UPI001314554B|nr:hypothetical protein [Leptospira stimsonii]
MIYQLRWKPTATLRGLLATSSLTRRNDLPTPLETNGYAPAAFWQHPPLRGG